MGKAKPFSREQAEEFEVMTADLSLQGKGAWTAIRMRLAILHDYTMTREIEQWGHFLRCSADQVLTVMKEFALSIACGFRVEWPPGNEDDYGKITEKLRVSYEPDEKVALFLKSESLRVTKYKEDKKKEEKKEMPENWNLSETMREFGERYGMNTETLRHEFQHCKLRHLESKFTDRGWERQVWQTWVLNWVKFGRKQVTEDGRSQPKSMVDLL